MNGEEAFSPHRGDDDGEEEKDEGPVGSSTKQEGPDFWARRDFLEIQLNP